MKSIKSFLLGLSLSVLLIAGVAGAVGVNSGGFGTPILAFPVGSELMIGASTPLTDSGGVLTLQNVDIIDATTEATIESAIDTLANLTSIQGQTVSITGTTTINQDVSTIGTPTFSGATISNEIIIGSSSPLSDSAGVLTLQNVDIIDATTEITIESAIDTLGDITFSGVIQKTPSSDIPLSSGTGIIITNGIMRVTGENQAVLLGATPTIADAADGVCAIIMGTSDTNYVRLQDADTVGSTGLALTATGQELGKGDSINLCYDLADDLWYEISYSDI